MSVSTQSKPNTAPKTLVGWQGMRFSLPPEWNVTGFSMDRGDGYLKVDSPGTMFAQVKWNDPRFRRSPKTLGNLLVGLWNRLRRAPAAEPKPPDLRAMLETFLKETGRQAKKSKAHFDSKVKPEVREANGERIAHHFSWSGGGQGQGKIWHCQTCGRIVIAQVVGQGRDNVAGVAAEMFDGLRDHAEEGWQVWALYDLVAGIPEDFALKSQKLMAGYLRLEFTRRGGERILLERWGLANVTRKRFTLEEWLLQTCRAEAQKIIASEANAQEHPAARATVNIRGPFAWLHAIREAGLSFRPASRYDGCVWECPETNKLYAVQVWHRVRTERLLEEVVARCECH